MNDQKLPGQLFFQLESWIWFLRVLPSQDIYLLLLVELQMERGPIAVPLAMHQCNVEIERDNLLQMDLEIPTKGLNCLRPVYDNCIRMY